jgi:hypothetical protein
MNKTFVLPTIWRDGIASNFRLPDLSVAAITTILQTLNPGEK